MNLNNLQGKRCILTLDNGETEKIVLFFKKNEPLFLEEKEKQIVEQINSSQPNMIHKVVKAHIMRN